MNGDKPTNGNQKANGYGGLIEMAKSGDNWVKLLIAGGVILNGYWTQQNKSEIRTTQTGVVANQTGIVDNSAEIGKFRKKAAAQLKVVFDNQRVLADFMDEIRASQDRIQTNAGIPHPVYQPYPRQEVPNYDDETN